MRAQILLLAVFSTFAFPFISSAGVPDPTRSTVPTCLVACPYGDIEFVVIVRDIVDAPVANAFVQIDLCACTTLSFCPTVMGGVPVCQRTVLSDAQGKATFAIRMGGSCPGATGKVYANGVSLSQGVSVRTVDLDGTLVVDGADVAIANALVGSAGGVADMDCSGLVDVSDVAFVEAHRGHTCDEIIPAQPASWGKVKTTYR